MIDRDNRICSLCGEHKYQGNYGGAGGHLVQLGGKNWKYKDGQKLELYPPSALFHAYHQVTLGQQAKRRYGLPPDQDPITVAELKALEMQQ